MLGAFSKATSVMGVASYMTNMALQNINAGHMPLYSSYFYVQ